ncbi:MAG TPA: SDR family NAD(P)-dependent oxidoreductase [Ignavibacteria bacterium]|nr:SDR family NAD(P)-dependent oxidoreductase [Ignavibacteria bacterium]HRF67177.1 SDR family NAD(P)-dependent oxidoreductase [Ignavibacteria bacterium]HRJ03168.1 SDR family NAD(P)-dependent oxidoreductase [Ignavibacteria bacterium]HRJ84451.1 SDR family NAD(P)-dependent oxidoreductase [Ignavibacteria bacterium]
MKLSGNKILITGGATGIGFGLAERFIKEGNSVVICGRRKDMLESAEEKLPGISTIQADLSSYESREALFNRIRMDHRDTNVLINNAGIQQWMAITDENFIQNAKDELAINVEAPVHLTHLFLKHEPLTTIMNVTSGLAFSPLAKTPVYCGTKAFLRSFTLSLRYLLKEKDIEVIELIPPALNTDLGGKGIHDFAPPVSGFIESVFEQLSAGKDEIAYQFSEAMLNAGPEERNAAFEKMNPFQK